MVTLFGVTQFVFVEIFLIGFVYGVFLIGVIVIFAVVVVVVFVVVTFVGVGLVEAYTSQSFELLFVAFVVKLLCLMKLFLNFRLSSKWSVVGLLRCSQCVCFLKISTVQIVLNRKHFFKRFK